MKGAEKYYNIFTLKSEYEIGKWGHSADFLSPKKLRIEQERDKVIITSDIDFLRFEVKGKVERSSS